MSHDGWDKPAHQRLSVLALARQLRDVSEACRQRGMSRTQFYEHKRRFQERGVDGLRALPPIRHAHPFTTLPEVEAESLVLGLAHPAWGCDRLSAHLKLEARHSAQALELSPKQVQFLEKQHPPSASATSRASGRARCSARTPSSAP